MKNSISPSIVQEISTHKAIRNGNKIDIFLKGISIPIGYEYPDGSTENDGFFTKDEYLYSIPYENKDDLFSIFERYEEDNRINVSEANEVFLSYYSTL